VNRYDRGKSLRVSRTLRSDLNTKEASDDQTKMNAVDSLGSGCRNNLYLFVRMTRTKRYIEIDVWNVLQSKMRIGLPKHNSLN
jgi:hypothetical protein